MSLKLSSEAEARLEEAIGAMVEKKLRASLSEVERKYTHAIPATGQETKPEIGRESAVEPGIRVARFIRTMEFARRGRMRPAEAAKQLYPMDALITKALGEGTDSAGGFIVPEEYSRELIPLLRDAGVIRQAGARMAPMNTNVLNIPRVTGGAIAQYLGESQNMPKSEPIFGQLKLSAKKLVSLVPMSNELMRDSDPSVDQWLRDDMVRALAEKADISFLRADGTANDPIGVRNTADVQIIGANTDAANGGRPTSEDLTRMLQLSAEGKKGAVVKGGWIFNRRGWKVLYDTKDLNGQFLFKAEMDSGRLFGYPFFLQDQIPNNLTKGSNTDTTEIYFGDWSEAIIGENMMLELEISTVASYWDGSQLQSAFSRDETVIRTVERHDFGLRYPKAFVIMTGVRNS